MRSGAVGINLTSANYVFMMEPLMNPALDDQAIGRAWRMGQKRPVTVKRFFVKGSMEEGVMSVNKTQRVRPLLCPLLRCLLRLHARAEPKGKDVCSPPAARFQHGVRPTSVRTRRARCGRTAPTSSLTR